MASKIDQWRFRIQNSELVARRAVRYICSAQARINQGPLTDLRIAVNTRLLLNGRLEGIGWYTHQMLERIVHAHPEHEFLFLFDRAFDPSFIFAPNVKGIVVHPQARHPVLFKIWFDYSVPIALRRHKADLFLSPDGIGSLTARIPQCLVIHDLAFEHYPRYAPASHVHYMRKGSPLWARKAAQVVTVSQYSKEDIAKRYHIPEEKITVTHNGANPAYKPLSYEERDAVKAQYTGGYEYFIFVGALHPRKNVTTLLKAFIAFKKRQRNNMKLLIVGRLAWHIEELEEMRDTMPFKEDVKWVGYMGVEELCKVMGAAYALVYPSLFEGFGIPILEALKCGVPAIVSNTSSMPEVGGDAALLADPTDYQSVAEKMGLIYKDELLRNKLIKAAPAQSARFDWDTSAARLWDVLMKCVKSEW